MSIPALRAIPLVLALLSLTAGVAGVGMTAWSAVATASAPRGDQGLDPAVATKARAEQAYGQLPISFEPNVGQTDPEALYLAHGQNYTLFLTNTGAVWSFVGSSRAAGTSTAPSRHINPRDRAAVGGAVAVRMEMIGGDPQPSVTAQDSLSGVVNYIVGNVSSRWHTGVPTFGMVAYRHLYPGIDMVWYGTEGQPEYDFVVAPGAHPAQIAIRFDGSTSVRIDPVSHDLVVATSMGELREHAPRIYQDKAGARSNVTGQFVLHAGGVVGFQLGAYDHTQPLVIDPAISYSTFLGGHATPSFDGNDTANAIAAGATGNVYVTGRTGSANFPATAGAFQTRAPGNGDAFVAEINTSASGSQSLVYSTFLGGSRSDGAPNPGLFGTFGSAGDEEGWAIAVDPGGDAYVTGVTDSTDFPVSPGALQKALAGPQNAFVAKLSATGSTLLYSTYLGGGVDQYGEGTGGVGFGIAIDALGNAYVVGDTNSVNFPTTLGAFQTTNFVSSSANPNGNGCCVAFLSKLNPTGSALSYSTFLGGSGDNFGASFARAVTVDSSGDAYVAGFTYESDFPTTAGAYQPPGGNCGGFVTKVDPSGAGLVYSTCFQSAGNGFSAIAVDPTGKTFVTGVMNSSTFPTTLGAFQTTNAGGHNAAFVTEFDASGSGVVASTYLGGSGGDQGNAITLDAAGDPFVTGSTSSSDFPTTPGAFKPTVPGNGDAFVTKLNATLTSLVYSTYLGGAAGADTGNGIALDNAGDAYVAGATGSQDFPTTPGGLQTTFGGGSCCQGPLDGFISKLNATGSNLLYSTYLGGGPNTAAAANGNDLAGGIAVDSAGSAYVFGSTDSLDFPVTAGAFQTTLATTATSNGVTFVAKLNPQGTGLVYSTYLGGTANGDQYHANGIAVDANGNASVAGLVNGTDFPVTAGAFSTSCSAPPCGFVTKLNAIGSGLLYSTYTPTEVNSVAAGPNGTTYLAANTSSTLWPTTPGAFSTSCARCQTFYDGVASAGTTSFTSASADFQSSDVGGILYRPTTGGQYTIQSVNASDPTTVTVAPAIAPADSGSQLFFQIYDNPGLRGSGAGVVARLNSAGKELAYSTYINGVVARVAVDTAGVAYFTGSSNAGGIPTTAGAYSATQGPAYVAKLKPGGHGSADLVYASYLGGGNPGAIAIGPGGTIYLGGSISNSGLVTTPGAFQNTFSGCHFRISGCTAFFMKVIPAGQGPADLAYSTFLGPGDGDTIGGIAVDTQGRAYLGGYTNGGGWPTTANAPESECVSCLFVTQTSAQGGAFLTEIDPTLQGDGSGVASASDPAVVFSTWLNSDGGDPHKAATVALDSRGNVFVTGADAGECGGPCGTPLWPFPITQGAFQPINAGPLASLQGSDAFVTKIGQLCGTPQMGTIKGSVTVKTGQAVCLENASVAGSVVVQKGGDLTVTNVSIGGALNANGATSLTLCGSTVAGSVSIMNSTGFVHVGDNGLDASCDPNTLKQGVTLSNNHMGAELGGNTINGSAVFNGTTGTSYNFEDAVPEIEANTITGTLACRANAQTPINDGQPNAVSGGESGQCATLDSTSGNESRSPAHNVTVPKPVPSRRPIPAQSFAQLGGGPRKGPITTR